MTGDLEHLRVEANELIQEFTAIALLTHAIDKSALAGVAADQAKLMTVKSRIKTQREKVDLWRNEKDVRASRHSGADGSRFRIIRGYLQSRRDCPNKPSRKHMKYVAVSDRQMADGASGSAEDAFLD